MKKITAKFNKCAETGKQIYKGQEMLYDYNAKKCYCIVSKKFKEFTPPPVDQPKEEGMDTAQENGNIQSQNITIHAPDWVRVFSLYKPFSGKIYKMICKDFGHLFSFHAKDDTEALAKKWDWCNYHSHNNQDYRLEETTEEKWMHDEYFT